MVARKPVQRTKGKAKTLKKKVGATKDDIDMETDHTETVVQQGKAETLEKEVDATNDDINTETDRTETVVQQKKKKLHRVKKTGRKSKARKKGQRVKLQLLGKDWKEHADVDKDLKKKTMEDEKSRNLSLSELNKIYHWGISLAGIPKDWKGDIEEVTNKYKEFGLKAFALARQSSESEVCQVLNLFFDNEEEMKKAVLSGPVNFLEKTLVLRTNPVRVIYISGVPFDKDEETVTSDIREALGPSVYDISVPTDAENMKLLGHAVAYVLDEATYKDLLNNHTLTLWDSVQHCCSKADFFSRFVINILSGCQNNREKVVKKLIQNIEKMGVQVVVSHSNKMYFLDEDSAEKVLKKSGMMLDERKMIFSHSPVVQYVMTNITKGVTKQKLEEYLSGINAFNLTFVDRRCKACFHVPAEEVEKCNALHNTFFFGRELSVLQSGSKELQLSRQKSRKKFQNLIDHDSDSITPGGRLYLLSELYQNAKKGTPGKSFPKKDETKKLHERKASNRKLKHQIQKKNKKRKSRKRKSATK